MKTSEKVTAHRDSSRTLPTELVVSAAYHEQNSARAMSGSNVPAAIRPNLLPAAPAQRLRTSTHWATRQSSATVAAARPMKALDSQESYRQNLLPSTLGRIDRNAHTTTKIPE